MYQFLKERINGPIGHAIDIFAIVGTVFGNPAIIVDTTVAAGALTKAVAADVSAALFRFLENLPLSALTSGIAVTLVVVFFVTSSDSDSLVVDIMASGGETDTWCVQCVFWCVLEGVVAAVVLLADGLSALQTATIASALPFAVVMLMLCWGLFRGMSADLARPTASERPAIAHPAARLSWQKRLASYCICRARQTSPGSSRARSSNSGVRCGEHDGQGPGGLDRSQSGQWGREPCGSDDEARNFVYFVRIALRWLPVFSVLDAAQAEARHEARTFFSDGSRGCDVMGMSKEQLISDVLAQFERYRKQIEST